MIVKHASPRKADIVKMVRLRKLRTDFIQTINANQLHL